MRSDATFEDDDELLTLNMYFLSLIHDTGTSVGINTNSLSNINPFS